MRNTKMNLINTMWTGTGIRVSFNPEQEDELKSWLQHTAIFIRNQVNKETHPCLFFYQDEGLSIIRLEFKSWLTIGKKIARINIVIKTGTGKFALEKLTGSISPLQIILEIDNLMDALQLARILVKYVELGEGAQIDSDHYVDEHEKLPPKGLVKYKSLNEHEFKCPACCHFLEKVDNTTDLRHVFIFPGEEREIPLKQLLPIEQQIGRTFHAYWYKMECKNCAVTLITFQVTVTDEFSPGWEEYEQYFLSMHEDHYRFPYPAARNSNATAIETGETWITSTFNTMQGNFQEHTFGPYLLDCEIDKWIEAKAIPLIYKFWEDFFTDL